jgi:hypothetical protein
MLKLTQICPAGTSTSSFLHHFNFFPLASEYFPYFLTHGILSSPVSDLESAVSPKSPRSFQWRMIFRNQALTTEVLIADGTHCVYYTLSMHKARWWSFQDLRSSYWHLFKSSMKEIFLSSTILHFIFSCSENCGF